LTSATENQTFSEPAL